MNYLTERPSRVNGGLLDFPRTVDDLFQRFWGGGATPRVETFRPHVDIIETPQAYLLRAELPGIAIGDVDVTLTGETLTIRGEKRLDDKQEGESWCLNERLTGRFERSFTFPAPVSAKEVEAEARNGVLTVRVMKAKEAQPRKVNIRVG